MSASQAAAERESTRVAWFALAALMAITAALITWATRGTTLFSDELLYFGRIVSRDGIAQPMQPGLEYLFAPFSGHLQVLGKLVYEAAFALTGAAYAPLRALSILLYLLSVGLFFELARRRVGPCAALPAAAVLLFMGAGWEVMLWPFNLHTLVALAAGLGALLALEREGRHADAVCCALLVLSISAIEVGLAFTVGVAVSVLTRADRRARLWVFGVPLALYLAWAAWARSFGQSEADLAQLPNLADSVAGSLAATAGSLTGSIDAGGTSYAFLVGSLGPEIALAALIAVALAIRLAKGGVAPSTWTLLAILLVYWASITVGFRQPDSSRYVLVGAILLLLVGADLIRGWRASPAVALAAGAIWLALALPLNLVKLFDGREALVEDARAVAAESAMLELAGPAAEAGYLPSADPRVRAAGPVPTRGLAAADYLEAAARVGSLGYTLEQLRAQNPSVRAGADATLVGALGVRLTDAKAGGGGCQVTPAGELELPPGGALIGATAAETPVAIGLARFAEAPASVPLGRAAPGEWKRLALPTDAAPDPWRLSANGPVELCPLPEGEPGE